ncbi:MAG: four helix bundle protein [Candidatus Levybacteria bacterium]|nr:four helix bundle protein [Candidatus Levybacteria bacterium]
MNKTIVNELVAKTLKELNAPAQPLQRSRIWKDPKGYQYLAVWQNAAFLRVLIRKFTLTLPLWEKRLKAQMDDCARSQKRNIEEGWKRPTTSEYLQFVGYSQASLEELKGDVRDCKTDGFLRVKEGSSLKDIGIDLHVFKGPLKGQAKGEPTEPGHPYYKPLSTLNPHTLTYEMFMELINKTDYLLRALVQSLEQKLAQNQKAYQLEQARIKSKIAKSTLY